MWTLKDLGYRKSPAAYILKKFVQIIPNGWKLNEIMTCGQFSEF